MPSLSIQSNFKSQMLLFRATSKVRCCLVTDQQEKKKIKSLFQERDSSETFEATEVEGSTGFSEEILLQSSNHSLSLSSEFDYKAQLEILALVPFPRLQDRKNRKEEGKRMESLRGISRDRAVQRTMNGQHKVWSKEDGKEKEGIETGKQAMKILTVGV